MRRERWGMGGCGGEGAYKTSTADVGEELHTYYIQLCVSLSFSLSLSVCVCVCVCVYI